MNLHEAPAFLAVKLATLSDGCATATIKADQLTAQIADLRDRFNGRVVRAFDHPEKLRIDIERLLEEQKTLQRQRPIEADILGRCRAWLAGLPSTTVFELTLRMDRRYPMCGRVPRNCRIKLRR